MRREKELPVLAKVHITSGFNNTIMTLSDLNGRALFWVSSGVSGFRGAKKSTPFAASTSALTLAKKAIEAGVKQVAVYVKGPGAGRDAAVKSLKAGGLEVVSISDVTPIPHNGCRPKKRRRV